MKAWLLLVCLPAALIAVGIVAHGLTRSTDTNPQPVRVPALFSEAKPIPMLTS